MTVFNLETSESLINQTFLWIPVEWYSYVAVFAYFINRLITVGIVYFASKGKQYEYTDHTIRYCMNFLLTIPFLI